MSEERLAELRRIAANSVGRNSTYKGWFPTGHAWELLDEIDRLREVMAFALNGYEHKDIPFALSEGMDALKKELKP